MVNTDRLQSLLCECRQKLALLDDAYRIELAKPVRLRRTHYLIFLDKERSVNAFGISLLTQLEEGRENSQN